MARGMTLTTVPRARTSLLDTVLLSVGRGALAGAVFVTLPALFSGVVWILFYALPVAVFLGGAMGALCAPVVWWILHCRCSLTTAAVAAATVAVTAWVAAVVVLLLASGSTMTGFWELFMLAPTPLGAGAAAWTLVTLRRRRASASVWPAASVGIWYGSPQDR